jgi:hypothetical protein
MRAIFVVEWDDDCGPYWMNTDNMNMLMHTKEHTKKEFARVVAQYHENGPDVQGGNDEAETE